jgi:sulfatase modifying factor 1
MTVAIDRFLLASCLLTVAACTGPTMRTHVATPVGTDRQDRERSSNGVADGSAERSPGPGRPVDHSCGPALGSGSDPCGGTKQTTSDGQKGGSPKEAGPPLPAPGHGPTDEPGVTPTVRPDPAARPVQSLLADEPPRCPPDMALVGHRLCVDRWEASLVQISPAGEQQPWSPYQSIDGATARLRAVSRAGVVPQGYISGVAAERACAASGKRLCTADEWTTACRGPKDTIYPYGSQHAKRRCNDDGRALHPVAEVTDRLHLPSDRMWYEGMDHPMINQLENTLRKTGERSGCTNDHGVFDMVGNLHEWTEDASGTFRGGYYMDTRRNGEGCNYATTAHSKSYHDYSTGFRCCMAADPVE